MKYILLILLVCIFNAVNAQRDHAKKAEPCGGLDSILNRVGKWKHVEDDLAFPDKTFPRNQFKLVYNRVDSIFSMFKKVITDMRGYEPRWYRGIRGESFTEKGPLPYTFSSLYFSYYCNDNKKQIFLGDETHVWYYVFVNHFNWFLQTLGDWDYKGDGKKIRIYRLPAKVGKWNNRTLYAPIMHGAETRAVVLGHNGKLPWRTLNQKEYLLGLKSDLEEARKKYGSNKTIMDEMEFCDKYLAENSEETLKQPAVIHARGSVMYHKKFADEEDGGSRVVVFSSAYWNKDLPRYAPQFMVVYWRHANEPASHSVKNQFEENFPLGKLQAMMDK